MIRQLTGLLVAMLVFTSASSGGETIRHSGVVLAVDRAAGTIILGELREWRAQEGVEVIRRPIAVEALEAWGLQEGDFVTVECIYEGSRLVATRIMRVDVERP